VGERLDYDSVLLEMACIVPAADITAEMEALP
jgi:hypothetical protein